MPIIQKEQPRKNTKNAKTGKETTKHTKYTNGQSAFRAVCNQHNVSNDQRRTSSTSFKSRVLSITARPTSDLSPDPSCPVHEASRLVTDYPERRAAKEHTERKDRKGNHATHEIHERSIGIPCRLQSTLRVERPTANIFHKFQVSSFKHHCASNVRPKSRPQLPRTRGVSPRCRLSRKTSRERTQRTQRSDGEPRRPRNTRTFNRHSVSSAINTACRTANGEHLPQVSSFRHHFASNVSPKSRPQPPRTRGVSPRCRLSRRTSRERTRRTQRSDGEPRRPRNTRTFNRHSVSSAINTACRMTNVERPMSNVPSCPSW